MDDIIAAAGMSAGGVYGYFTGKNAIVTAIAEEAVGSIAARIGEVLTLDPVPPLAEGLARVFAAVDELALRSGRLAVQVWGEAQLDAGIAALAATEMTVIRGAVTALVLRARDDGQLPPDLDVDAAGQVLFALAPGYLLQQRILGDVRADRFAAALAALLGHRPARPPTGPPDG